ncbi:MAG: HIT domain-containing protein [Candidatus Woesearchaeota archaeon]|nr:HIT domain-containing protein [Candidatus Woesearchaeota archaeon]
MDNGCALCAAQQEDYRLVYKDKHCFCIANIEPLNHGHFMVLPTRHVSELGSLTAEEVHAIHQLFHRLETAVKKEYGHDALIALNRGSNTSQDHIHYHILPVPHAFRKVVSRSEGLPERVRGTADQLSAMRDRLVKHL